MRYGTEDRSLPFTKRIGRSKHQAENKSNDQHISNLGFLQGMLNFWRSFWRKTSPTSLPPWCTISRNFQAHREACQLMKSRNCLVILFIISTTISKEWFTFFTFAWLLLTMNNEWDLIYQATNVKSKYWRKWTETPTLHRPIHPKCAGILMSVMKQLSYSLEKIQRNRNLFHHMFVVINLTETKQINHERTESIFGCCLSWSVAIDINIAEWIRPHPIWKSNFLRTHNGFTFLTKWIASVWMTPYIP